MTEVSTSANAAAIAKLGRLAPLGEGSIALLSSLQQLETYSAGQTIRTAGKTVRRPAFFSEGWAARYQLLSDGRRQIVSLLLPGDHLGFEDDVRTEPDLSIVTLTRVRMSNATPVRTALGAPDAGMHADLQTAIRRAEALERSRLVNHIVRLGRQSALERTAHLFSELWERLRCVNLSDRNSFPLPLTQECLADALGLSIVHVNRTLQQLRRDQLLSAGGGSVRVLNPELLNVVSDYQSTSTL